MKFRACLPHRQTLVSWGSSPRVLGLVNTHQQPGGCEVSKHYGHPRAPEERSKQALRGEARQAVYPKLACSWPGAIGGSGEKGCPARFLFFHQRKQAPGPS